MIGEGQNDPPAILSRCPAHDQPQSLKAMNQLGCAVRLEDQSIRHIADRGLPCPGATYRKQGLMLLRRQADRTGSGFAERKEAAQRRAKVRQHGIVGIGESRNFRGHKSIHD